MKRLRIYLGIASLLAVNAGAISAGAEESKFEPGGVCAERFSSAAGAAGDAGDAGDARGIDVSKFQGEIDWQKIDRQDLHFVIIRAAYGDRMDIDFAHNAKAAGETCLLRAAYQFYDAAVPPAAQAAALAAATRQAAFELPAVVDVERLSIKADLCANRTAAVAFMDNLAKYFSALEQRPTGRVTIYTSRGFWSCLPRHDGVPGDHDLWIAEYTTAPSPHIPEDWRTWRFWQYADTQHAKGIRGDVDTDRFNGPPSALLDYARTRGSTPERR